jgi:hypothetical protein
MGSGKSTAARYLVEKKGYVEETLAAPLKDAVAAIFRWPRHLLEGDTEESRRFRETVDPWWAAKLGRPDWSPRVALQYVGTEMFRKILSEDIWVHNLKMRLDEYPEGSKVVVPDVRFDNERRHLMAEGAISMVVVRSEASETQKTGIPNHESERGLPVHFGENVIVNSGTIPALEHMVDTCIGNFDREKRQRDEKVKQDLVMVTVGKDEYGGIEIVQEQ